MKQLYSFSRVRVTEYSWPLSRMGLSFKDLLIYRFFFQYTYYYVYDLWWLGSVDVVSMDMEGWLRESGIHRFWYLQGYLGRTSPPWILKDMCTKNSVNWTTETYTFTALEVQFSSVQLLSRVWLFATPWTAAHQASLSITNSQSPPKPMSIVSVMPCSHLILCHLLLLLPSIFPSIRVFFNELVLCITGPKYWSLSFNISPSNKHPELISFRMDWLDCLVSLWNACVVSWGTTSEPNQWNPCPHGAYILMEDID